MKETGRARGGEGESKEGRNKGKKGETHTHKCIKPYKQIYTHDR